MSTDRATPNATLQLALEVRNALQAHQLRLVLAESCTAGRVAAALASFPGVSNWLCGSFVVYRSASKQQWLGVPNSVLDDPQLGPVSGLASRLLATAALERTSEADLSVAVTGDVGPGAPSHTDGRLFMAAVRRGESIREAQADLLAPVPGDASDVLARIVRLEEATQIVLRFILSQMPHKPGLR